VAIINSKVFWVAYGGSMLFMDIDLSKNKIMLQFKRLKKLVIK
jgi:hypothetical protein